MLGPLRRSTFRPRTPISLFTLSDRLTSRPFHLHRSINCSDPLSVSSHPPSLRSSIRSDSRGRRFASLLTQPDAVTSAVLPPPPPSMSPIESHGNFDLVQRVKLDYTDVTLSKWRSRETGLSVVHVDYECPCIVFIYDFESGQK